jgi:hypothetical protein
LPILSCTIILLFIDNSGSKKINLLNGNCFEEVDLADFAVYVVPATCMIETFMNDVAGRKKTYKPFKGNTYYQFVEDEELNDQREVILMYMVSEFNIIIVILDTIIAVDLVSWRKGGTQII